MDIVVKEVNLTVLTGIVMQLLNEKLRRMVLGALCHCIGRGSVKLLSELTGVARDTIIKGKKEVSELPLDPTARPKASSLEQIREKGGGRKKASDKNKEIRERILRLVEPNTVGNPENPLLWTTKSLRNISDELDKEGIDISYVTVGKILEEEGFSLQQNKKYTEAGEPSPDRDEQFQFINDQCKEFMAESQPVISVDTKKKELVGNYKNGGREYCHQGQPTLVNDHDFGKDRACPYGIYDIAANSGYVNVGVSADTGQFAVNSIRNWWYGMGAKRYPNAKQLMITCDGGGSNGRRNRLWKTSLQEFANETGLEIHVSHFPPGTSKWNKIEHRMFSFISKNWRGRPLESLAIIVSLIAATTTKKGLKVQCSLDKNEYLKGMKVSDEEMAKLNIQQNEWHGEWNYVIAPQNEAA